MWSLGVSEELTREAMNAKSDPSEEERKGRVVPTQILGL